MNKEDLLETKEIGNYRISVWRGDCPICPLKDLDMTGMFLWNDDSRGRCRIEQCGILSRLVATERDGKIRYVYYAGQDYPSEARLVRKILRARYRRF